MNIKYLKSLILLLLLTVTLYSQDFNNEELKSQVEKNCNNFSPFFYDSTISILFYLRPESSELELIGSVCPVNKTSSFLQKKIGKLGRSSYSVTLEESIHSITELKSFLEKELDYNSILYIHYSGEDFLVKKYLIE